MGVVLCDFPGDRQRRLLVSILLSWVFSQSPWKKSGPLGLHHALGNPGSLHGEATQKELTEEGASPGPHIIPVKHSTVS